MKVVLDTNIVFRTRQRLLYGVEIEVLQEARTKTPLTIVVPEVVKLELASLYRRSYQEELAGFTKHARKLQALLTEADVQSLCSVDENAAVARYERLLAERLTSLNAECPNYASVPHSAILERCLAARKPFKPSREGYRDALIWETVLREVAGPDHLTVLITDNSNDFADVKDNNKLHDDLLADLDASGLKPDSVRLCQSIEAFNKRYLLPDMEFLESLVKQIDDGQQPEIQSFMMDHYEEALERARERAVLDDTIVSACLEESVTGAFIAEIHPNVSEEGATDVRKLSDDRLLLDMPATYFCLIEFLLERDAAQRLMRRNLIAFEDVNWSETMTDAKAVFEIGFSIQMILRSPELTLVSWDLSPVVLHRVWSTDELQGG